MRRSDSALKIVCRRQRRIEKMNARGTKVSRIRSCKRMHNWNKRPLT